MEDIKDEENSDSSFTLSDFDSESDKEESLQEEQYHIESSGSDWEEINEGILDNRSENSIINNINLNNKKNLNFPVDFFCLFFTNDLLNKIIEYTNIYANNKFSKSKAKKQKKRIWKNINIFDLKAFIGIIIAMGIIHKNVIEDYWNDDSIFSTPGISDIMTYSQFSYIYKYIYFTNEANPTKYEKIQILYDEIIINSQNIYLPERALSLDECIIKYT